jgi:hypothetical protein
MKSWMISGLTIAVLLSNALPVPAYETPTHSDLTAYAVAHSVLVSDPMFLFELGMDDNDIQSIEFPGVVPANEEYPVPEKTIFLKNASILRIIKAGAVLEDASTNSLHHFYDAMNGGRGLTLETGRYSFAVGMPSPEWILEDENHTSDLLMLLQKYSYRDSIEYFYKGLTSEYAHDRNTNLGRMFRGIGHLVHHIQDMAQPQHVRNDQHCDKNAAPVCFLIHNPSYFEKYTDRHRKAIIPYIINQTIPKFPQLRQYWINSSGTGLAEFTQSNFISQGTNFTIDGSGIPGANKKYTLPDPQQNSSPAVVELAVLLHEAGMDVDRFGKIMADIDCSRASKCDVGFISNTVHDARVAGSSINYRASTISLLADEIRQRKIKGGLVTTYNSLNFHAAYPYLIHRAIAYSAGMINHFFRGRLSAEFISTKPDGRKIIKITNRSLSGDTFTAGKFEIYYDSVSGLRKPLARFQILSGSLPLQSGDSLQIALVRPNDVNEQVLNPYLLVFNARDGVIGGEPGIAARKFELTKKGRVLRVSRGTAMCPGVKDEVLIAFPEQPDNGGQLFLRGDKIYAMLDFRNIPSGVEVIKHGARWYHGYDEDTGEYRYEVTYRHPGAEVSPCSGSVVEFWLLNDDVSALFWEDIYGPIK